MADNKNGLPNISLPEIKMPKIPNIEVPTIKQGRPSTGIDPKTFKLEEWDVDQDYKDFTEPLNKKLLETNSWIRDTSDSWDEWSESQKKSYKEWMDKWRKDWTKWLDEGDNSEAKKFWIDPVVAPIQDIVDAAAGSLFSFYDGISSQWSSLEKEVNDDLTSLFNNKMARASRTNSTDSKNRNNSRYYSGNEFTENGWSKLGSNVVAALAPWSKSKKEKELETEKKEAKKELQQDPDKEEVLDVCNFSIQLKKLNSTTDENEKSESSKTKASIKKNTVESGQPLGFVTRIMQDLDAQLQYFIIWFTEKDDDGNDVLVQIESPVKNGDGTARHYYYFYISDVSFKPYSISTTQLKYGPLQTSSRILSKVKNGNEFSIKTSLDIGLSFYNFISEKCMGFNWEEGLLSSTVRGNSYQTESLNTDSAEVNLKKSKIDLHIIIPSKTLVDGSNKNIFVNHFVLKDIQFSDLDKIPFGHSASQVNSNIKGIYRKAILIQNEKLGSVPIKNMEVNLDWVPENSYPRPWDANRQSPDTGSNTTED